MLAQPSIDLSSSLIITVRGNAVQVTCSPQGYPPATVAVSEYDHVNTALSTLEVAILHACHQFIIITLVISATNTVYSVNQVFLLNQEFN